MSNKFWDLAILALVSKPIAFVLIEYMLEFMQKHPEQQMSLSISCLLIALSVCYIWFKFGVALYFQFKKNTKNRNKK